MSEATILHLAAAAVGFESVYEISIVLPVANCPDCKKASNFKSTPHKIKREEKVTHLNEN